MSDIVMSVKRLQDCLEGSLLPRWPDGGLIFVVPDDLRKVLAEIERLQDALHQIETWSRAYPLSIFPEPDLKRAAELLRAGGITLDAVSASAMRHVIEGVGKIARAALERKP